MSGEGQFGANLAAVLAKGTNVKGLKIAYGLHTTVAAVDTVATGLQTVLSVQTSLVSDPVAGMQSVTAALSATAGSIEIKGWKATATADTALIAATTFSKGVYWFAIGT